MSVLVPGNLASDGPAAHGETDLGGGAGRDPLQQELWGSHPFQVTYGKAGAGTDLPTPHPGAGTHFTQVSVAGVADGR